MRLNKVYSVKLRMLKNTKKNVFIFSLGSLKTITKKLNKLQVLELLLLEQ